MPWLILDMHLPVKFLVVLKIRDALPADQYSREECLGTVSRQVLAMESNQYPPKQVSNIEISAGPTNNRGGKWHASVIYATAFSPTASLVSLVSLVGYFCSALCE